MENNQLRSKLSQARGLGAAKHGVEHWWIQRLTAIALVPLSVWFLASLMAVANSPDPFRVADWLSSPCTAIALALFIVALFWHAKLGLQVVIEDYVHAPAPKYTLLIANTFFCVTAGAMALMALLRLHMFDLVAGT